MEVENDAVAANETGVSEGTSDSNTDSKSIGDSIDKAFASLEAAEAEKPNETAQAAEVLKNGAGADEKAVKAAEDKVDAAQKGVEKAVKDQSEPKKEADTKSDASKSEKTDKTDKTDEPAKEAVAPDAPKWMSKKTAEEWANAPESVRNEVLKRSEGFDKGIQQFKEKADEFDKIADIADMAKSAKVELKDFVNSYVELDQLFARNPTAAIEQMLNAREISLEQFAQHVLQNSGDLKTNNQVSQLEHKIEQLQQQLTRKEQAENQHRVTQARGTLQSVINKFAENNNRFGELEPQITKILNGGLVERTGDLQTDLQAAYDMAERMNPLPVVTPAQGQPATDQHAAQTRKADVTMSGSPGSGSNLGSQRPSSKSPREAVDKAFANLGF